MTSRSCALCGNERPQNKIDKNCLVGKKCLSLITTTLSRQYLFWKEANERYGNGGYGLGRFTDCLFFQASGWKQCPLTIWGKPRVRRGPASIEMGVMFNQEDDEIGQVKTFYTASGWQSLTTYGDAFLYPKDVKDKWFWRKLERQLDGAAQAVFDDHQGQYLQMLRALGYSSVRRLKRRIT